MASTTNNQTLLKWSNVAVAPKPMAKTPPITVEKGAIGMWTPKATVLPPKPTVAPSVWEAKTTTVSQIESKLNNLIWDKTYNKNTIDEFIKKAQDIPWFWKEYLWIKKIKTKEDLIKFVNKQVKKNNIPDAIDEISDTPIDMSPEARKKTMDWVMKAMGKPPATKWFKWLWKETMEQNIAKVDDNLMQEAKKYKSAEEFMLWNIKSKNKFTSPMETFKRLDELDSQELNRAIWTTDWENIPKEITLYRWINKKWDFWLTPWDFLTKSKKIAEDFGKWWTVKSFKVKTKDLLWDTYGNEEVLYAPQDYYNNIREQANKKPLLPLPKKWK
jgi:hypothetical protein